MMNPVVETETIAAGKMTLDSFYSQAANLPSAAPYPDVISKYYVVLLLIEKLTEIKHFISDVIIDMGFYFGCLDFGA